MRKFWQMAIPAAFVGLLVTTPAATPAIPLERQKEYTKEEQELCTEFQTPHPDWAQPYALGKVRLL